MPTSPPQVREQIFDRLTKGDSYFLHQVRKNRRRQHNRRRNHSPFDALDQQQQHMHNGSTMSDPLSTAASASHSAQMGQAHHHGASGGGGSHSVGGEYRDTHGGSGTSPSNLGANGLPVSASRSASYSHPPGAASHRKHSASSPSSVSSQPYASASHSQKPASKLDSYLDQLREQHSTKEKWKKDMELQKEKMEDWNEELRSKIAHVDRLKEELKENHEKHEQKLKSERTRLETEFNAKKLRLQKKEVSLYKLMEDIKNRTDRNAQREKYMDLREQEVKQQMDETQKQIQQFQSEKGSLLEEIEKLKDTIKKRDHQIMLFEKKLQIAEQDKIQYDKDRKELEDARRRIADLETDLRRATVERENYATEREKEIKKRTKQLEEQQNNLEQREHILKENETRVDAVLQREKDIERRENEHREEKLEFEKKTIELNQKILEHEKQRHEESKQDYEKTKEEFELRKQQLEQEFTDKFQNQERLVDEIKQELEQIRQQKDEAVKELHESQNVKEQYLTKLNRLTTSQNPQALVKTSSSQLEKRLTYISSAVKPLTDEEMDKLVDQSIAYNREQGITSILVCVKHIFIHIIEGETDEVDRLFGKIYKDERHERIQVVNIEENIKERKFAESYLNHITVQDPTATAFLSMLMKLKKDQEIIENYMQPPVLAMIKSKTNPLKLPCTRKNRVVMQCEMFRFNDLVELMPAHKLKDMCNQYFNLCSRLIQRNGGQVVSFREDTIIAYFEIQSATRAVNAAVDIIRRLHKYREKNQNPLNRLKTTFVGIGITKGPTIEGTLGGPVMKQYTILGPTVRRARLLQYFSRTSPHFIHFDERIKNDLIEQQNEMEHQQTGASHSEVDYSSLIVDAGEMESETITCKAYSVVRSGIQYTPESSIHLLDEHIRKLERIRRSETTLQKNGIFLQRLEDDQQGEESSHRASSPHTHHHHDEEHHGNTESMLSDEHSEELASFNIYENDSLVGSPQTAWRASARIFSPTGTNEPETPATQVARHSSLSTSGTAGTSGEVPVNTRSRRVSTGAGSIFKIFAKKGTR